jgi:hypothetical protein
MIADSYLDARARLEGAIDRLRAARRLIGKLEQALMTHPTGIYFQNYPSNQVVTEDQSRSSFDALAWPGIDDIVHLINDYHAAREEALALWDALTPEKKRGVRNPTDLLEAR